jgi:hypothetical protein
MDQSLADYLRAELTEGKQETAHDILSILIQWYAECGIAMEVRLKDSFIGGK